MVCYNEMKLGFLELICKDSLIFQSNFELSFSIILKARESQYVALEYRC